MSHMIPIRIGAIKRAMRVLLATPLLLVATLFGGCQSAPSNDAMEADRPSAAAVAGLRRAFLAGNELPDRLRQLADLELQAMRLAEDEPLRLGALGTAILDICQGSLTGHYALRRFYEHLDSPDAADSHAAWMDAIKAHMAGSADGTPDNPYTSLTPVEAQIFVIAESLSPVGAIYQSTEPESFYMLVVGRPVQGPLKQFHFNLDALYRTTVNSLSDKAAGQAPHFEFTPLTLMGILARSGDATAQAAVGAMLMARNQHDDAIGWLRSASRTGNVIANVMLARIFWEKSLTADTDDDRREALDQVMENYLHAIALGSRDAMYALGSLYLTGAFGEDNEASGVPLLEQAGDLGHSDALHYLAHLYYAGDGVERDTARAGVYFIRSAALSNAAARLGYARYLIREGSDTGGDGRAIQWLKELVEENEDPQAMLLLGNLHARGIAARQSFRTAHRWYRHAARVAPNNADIVNEVAWTLTVSDLARLRKARYALKIMTHMMESDDQARTSPEFLDTWAATFAANGNFDEAVRLQQLALKEATDADREDVLGILKEHLDLFMAGKPVIEPAP